ncbi:MAG: class I SAM-dependent methyltransferase [Chitinophagaceae bacterium]|nr:class I SAM-dependent methyltransferase [Chitinophagaceae bacterium]
MVKSTEVQSVNRVIKCYDVPGVNIDHKTVSSFGVEWNAFHGFSELDLQYTGDMYFDIVTKEMLNDQSTVIDIGCGSGRWIKYLDGRYKKVIGLDPSEAIFAADKLLGKNDKVELVRSSTDHIPFPDGYFDFAYSLGVLHHIPDTEKALVDSVRKVKSGGHFLVYLYYRFENRPFYFRIFYWLSNLVRRGVCKLPHRLKKGVCNFLAVILYMPFVLLCRFLRFIGVPEKIRFHIPLQAYEKQSFYIIRNDSLDRFGTPLEQRFSTKQITAMMTKAGLTDIRFSDKIPFWHAVGRKI